MVPSTLRSGRAPCGQRALSATSTSTVPFTAEGSIRITRPGMMPLRVSIDAGCPMAMSFASVSVILTCAFSLSCWATFARMLPGSHILPGFERRRVGGSGTRVAELLQHAGHSGPHAQLIHLLLLELVRGLELIDLYPLGGQLRFHGFMDDAEPLLFQLIAKFELLGFALRKLYVEIRDEAELRELLRRGRRRVSHRLSPNSPERPRPACRRWCFAASR